MFAICANPRDTSTILECYTFHVKYPDPENDDLHSVTLEIQHKKQGRWKYTRDEISSQMTVILRRLLMITQTSEVSIGS